VDLNAKIKGNQN